MTIAELRISNLVMQNGFYGYVYSIASPEPRKEKRFSDKAVITLFDNGLTTVPIDEIEPITLTEEWLLKFGFEKSESKVSGSDYYTLSNYSIMVNNNYFHFSLTSLESRYLTIINHVHQLQNLYFALTGKELIKE